MLPNFPSRNFVQVVLPKAGLGHSMQSYSRAFSYYAAGQAEFIHPHWFKFRIGPYLRNELDKRSYHRIICTPSDWGLSQWHSLRRHFNRVVTEDTFDPKSQGQFLVVKDDRPHQFSLIQPYRAQFIEALHSISRIKSVRRLDSSPTIGIFHRSGDMRGRHPSQSDDRRLRTHGYGYIPVGYAAEALLKVREIAGWCVPAVLSSDGDSDEISPIMTQGNVVLARSDSALTNMLEMSQHDLLIIGTSSYGRWSWFLGDAFAIVPLIEDTANSLPPIEDREKAWFVYDDDTQLNDVGMADRVRQLLARK